MKTLINSFLFFIFFTSVMAQVNLVPNPSFEIYDTCQTLNGQIYRAVGWDNYGSTVEYFNSCANITALGPYLGVPINEHGHQIAKQGNAYGSFLLRSSLPELREFAGRQLSQPLVIGQNYYVSFYVSLVDTFSYDCAINKIGIKFSTIPYSLSLPAPVTNSAHIFTSTIITDKVNWTKISGWFVTDSAYNYIMIGNFFDDAHTDTANCNSHSFYYFDYVCVSTDSLGCLIINESVPTLDTEIDKVNVFPNPSNEEINISSAINEIEKIELYSIDGKLILSENYERRFNVSIAVNKFNAGIYFINIITKNNNSIKNKISIIH